MRKTNSFIITVVAFLVSFSGIAQQLADTLYTPVIENPNYEKGQGPTLLLDEAHGNFHTLSGRFLPFAKALEKDGYLVEASSAQFTSEHLRSGKILVIANALDASNLQEWTLPTPSAFTDSEIDAVKEWVKEGGSLFLIADHMPFPGASEKLAASFGFKFYNGFAMKKGGAKDIFSSGNGLIDNLVTQGRNDKETVTSVQTFTGQAFEIPKNARPIIVLNSKYEVKMPKTAWQFEKDTPTFSAENLAQGAYMDYGKGKIVVFGEAAMFTAQRQGKNEVGMNQKSASQNLQLLLNLIHWLDGTLD